MTKFYKPVRDDITDYWQGKSKPGWKPMLADLTVPVYVLNAVRDDLRDIIKALNLGFYKEENHSIREQLFQELKMPFDEFFIEYPDGWWSICMYISRHDDCYIVYRASRGERQGVVISDEVSVIRGGSIQNMSDPQSFTQFNNEHKMKVTVNDSNNGPFNEANLSLDYLLAFLTLMQCKNVRSEGISYTARQLRDLSRSTQGRVNDPPQYRTLIIDRPAGAEAGYIEDDSEGEAAKRRRHQVPGHFKELRSERYRPEVRGRIWISPYWRGDESLGTVTSPIVVKKAS